MGLLVFEELDLSWQGALVTEKANNILGFMEKRENSRSREVIAPSTLLFRDPTYSTASSSGAPSARET